MSANGGSTVSFNYLDEVHIALVLSTKAHAKILGVDPSAALDLPGVVCYLDHRDVPGENTYGVFGPTDEELFATEKVKKTVRYFNPDS
jgi:xanthine dehydrogenase/oxidase